MTTAKEIFEDIMPDKLESNDDVSDIDAVYQFNIDEDDDKVWHIDFTKDSDYVGAGPNEDADCTIDVAEDDFVGMWNGDLSGQQLFMMGKISVDGDMSLALKLQKFIG